MPDRSWLFSSRRAETAVGLLLAAVSLAPWWTRRVDGSRVSVWAGPHFTWLPVLLCLAIVAGRSLRWVELGDRWAATGIVVALAVTGWGWASELTGSASPDDGQLAWVLQEQGSYDRPFAGPFDIAWGCPAGLCLMGLLLAILTGGGKVRRTP